jgi:hypothetical protein
MKNIFLSFTSDFMETREQPEKLIEPSEKPV